MKQLKTVALAAVVLAAAVMTVTRVMAQTTQNVTYVTNAYELKVQQVTAGSLADGTSYSLFAGEAKAVNNKVAADLRAFAFTLFYKADESGIVTVTGGTFLVQTTNKDRLPLIVGGSILPGQPLTLRSDGWIAIGETLSLSLLGGDGTGITGTLIATIDKSNPPRAFGPLSLTYPVIQ
jgi:hypothetical protein